MNKSKKGILPPEAYKTPQQILFEQIYVAPALNPEPLNQRDPATPQMPKIK